MEEIVTILSTREWAIAIWCTGFFVWMLTQRKIRKSLWNVIKILLGKNLRHFFLIIALYVAGITMIFYQLPFWNNIYLKDIILWLIIPVITILILMNVVAESEEKYRRVHKLIDIVLACIGWYMLCEGEYTLSCIHPLPCSIINTRQYWNKYHTLRRQP